MRRPADLEVRLLVVVLAVLSVNGLYAQNSQQPAYLDTVVVCPNSGRPIWSSRMTVEEKVSQLVNQSRAIPRLSVPDYDWWSEALHGVANTGGITVFPEPIGLAATFDPEAINRMADCDRH